MTPPGEAALLHDLTTLRRMGFNAVRVHIKVESRRFYHLCDRLGLMVVQDMVSGGVPPLGIRASGAVQALGFTLPDRSAVFRRWTGRGGAAGRGRFVRELVGVIRHLRAHPCIVVWVPFNEAWGQFDARGAERLVRRADPTRLVDAASGWFDQGGGDFRSRHRYVLRLVAPPRGDGRAFYLSEFGGLNLAVEGHVWCDPAPFGYRFLEDRGALARAMTELYRDQLVPLVAGGLAACTYTQVSDVERESNGLMTYDRVVTKVDPALMARLNRELEEAFSRARRA
jgi:glycosyl hydrolase, family 2